MVSYIEGELVEKNPAFVVLECNGIGYMINITVNTFVHLKELTACRLFTHLAIKNEGTNPTGISLYGFFDEKERHFFRQLISVSGVGYSTAVLILSSLSTEKLYQAIVEKNVSLLQTVKGIGAKSAQRIIIDLKDKLEKSRLSSEFSKSGYNTNKEAALSGLIILGFNKAGAEKALEKVLQKQGGALAVEDLIKEALKIL